jgi:hypothetical protein
MTNTLTPLNKVSICIIVVSILMLLSSVLHGDNIEKTTNYKEISKLINKSKEICIKNLVWRNNNQEVDSTEELWVERRNIGSVYLVVFLNNLEYKLIECEMFNKEINDELLKELTFIPNEILEEWDVINKTHVHSVYDLFIRSISIKPWFDDVLPY